MIFVEYKKCPVCVGSEVHLNTWDLMECPQCNLMLSMAMPATATVLKERGKGEFRFEDVTFNSMCSDLVLAPSSDRNPVLPDDKHWFSSTRGIEEYLEPKGNTEKDKNYTLWTSFKDELVNKLGTFSRDELSDAWSSKSNRTVFYKESLLPLVSKELGLFHGNEEFTVDYVMSKSFYDDVYVPQIQIESENDIRTANQEMNKLCRLNSPLRVLVTVFDGWDGSKNQKIYDYLRTWQKTIEAHGSMNMGEFSGVIGVLIGSYHNKELTYYSVAFWSNGTLRQPLRALQSFCLERN
ncbi:hypothetical protein [Vibrio sp. V09_P4A23P171]|uniref:hypothetical protein n=1 Tax=Vibrio sp. V09_P4A23P171 TaxID=1938664 RepID=UPI0011407DC3|nr:hypothetical protein [Vibrio sp. V09_P4A23P171]